MAEPNTQPIIIIKKKSGHAAHHGGAWKVAYADFVTAMMALFIVLWLMNSSEQVKKAVAGYFADPGGQKGESGSGVAGAGEAISLGPADMDKLKDKLEAAMKKMPEFEKIKDQVEMTVTGEGLRIELLETEHGLFFESGNSQPSLQGKELIAKLTSELMKMKNKILIEGHTDAKPFMKEGYSNWELSADRANSARRLMQAAGLPEDKITQVRGFAAQRLRDKTDPGAASNRRISLIVQYQNADIGVPEPPGKKGEGKAVSNEGHGKEGEKQADAKPGGEHAPPPKEAAHAEQKAAPAHK